MGFDPSGHAAHEAAHRCGRPALLNHKRGRIKARDAVPALEDDLGVLREFLEAGGNVLEEHVHRTRNVSGLIFPGLAQVDDGNRIVAIHARLEILGRDFCNMYQCQPPMAEKRVCCIFLPC